ncbi:MAG: GGDEF domain-containing protein [Ectothiorhodospiraceae bacterium]|nr:GGDEF domain-containing protein [Ectothiorhodospiraceae bacterium]
MNPLDQETARAQRLRLRRVLWGSGVYCCTSLIVLGCYLAGFIEGRPALIFFSALAALNLGFIGMILSGLNLRLGDPSMTGIQIVSSLWPSIYVMYPLGEPQARMAFLLVAVVAMLFGGFRFDFRGMLTLGATVLLTYLLLLVALVQWAPERVDVRVEAIIVFAYSVVLALVAYLGSFIAGLRRSLMRRNRELETAMAELRELATRDPLTRLPNRRTLMEQLDRETARAERGELCKSPLSICMLDIDLFKRINDSYGHQAGDAVLRRVAAALRRSLRNGDFVGRFGGEEFLLLFPESSREEAQELAELIGRNLAAMRIPELPGNEAITASIGVAVHRKGETLEETLARADSALYEAKRRGRNRAVVADGPTPAMAHQA